MPHKSVDTLNGGCVCEGGGLPQISSCFLSFVVCLYVRCRQTGLGKVRAMLNPSASTRDQLCSVQI